MELRFELDSEIMNILPAHTEEQIAALTAEIEERSHVDLGVVGEWPGGKLTLLDGYGRQLVCTRLKIIFPTRKIKFESRDAALQWVIDNQLKTRRNLTDAQRAYLIGKDYLLAKQPHGGQVPNIEKGIGQNGLSLSTAAAVAEKHGVSENTVKRDAKFAEAVDTLPPEEKAEVLTGQSDKPKAAVIDETKYLCDACKYSKKIGRSLTPDCAGCAVIRKKAGVDKHGKKKKPKKAKPGRTAVKDKTGAVVPDHLRDPFADPQLSELLATVKEASELLEPEKWTKLAGKLATSFYPFILIDKFGTALQDAKESLQNAHAHLEAGLPYAVCPKCNGVDSTANGKACRGCRGCGHVAEDRFNELSKA